MNKIDRHAIFAVGLVVGIAIALLFFVWAFPWFSDPPQGAGYNNSGDGQGTYQCCNRNDPHFGVHPFLRWLYVDDSLAQRTMAVFSVVATLVSTLAVILVKDTLLETRRIGEAQTRAYLGIESMMLSRSSRKKGSNARISFKLRNFGQSTARYVTATTITKYKDGSEGDPIPHRFGLTPPSHSRDGILDVINTGDDIFDIQLKVVIEYDDIFNSKWRQEASYYIFRDDSIRPGEYQMYILPNTATEQKQS